MPPQWDEKQVRTAIFSYWLKTCNMEAFHGRIKVGSMFKTARHVRVMTAAVLLGTLAGCGHRLRPDEIYNAPSDPSIPAATLRGSHTYSFFPGDRMVCAGTIDGKVVQMISANCDNAVPISAGPHLLELHFADGADFFADTEVTLDAQAGRQYEIRFSRANGYVDLSIADIGTGQLVLPAQHLLETMTARTMVYIPAVRR